MEEMIKRIIDMDRKAQEITEAARREKLESEKELVKRPRRSKRNTWIAPAAASKSTPRPNRRCSSRNGASARNTMPNRRPASSGCMRKSIRSGWPILSKR